LDPDEQERQSRKLYESLRALVSQEDALVTRLSRSGDTQRFKIKFPENDVLEDDDKQKILAILYDWGNHIYRDIFEGSTQLRSFMKAFEEADSGNPPHRVLINTTNLSLPWQLLHTQGALNEDRFWRVRYRLSVVPMGRIFPGRLPDDFALEARTSVVFGVYSKRADGDGVGPR